MESGLFRRKSLEKITSQEEMHDYLRITSPRLWMILGAILLLLAGFAAYGATATMESTMPIQVEVESFAMLPEYQKEGNEQISLVSSRLPASAADTVSSGMRVRVGEYEGTVSFVAEDEDAISLLIEMDDGYIPLSNGTYDAVLVLESTAPISLLWK